MRNLIIFFILLAALLNACVSIPEEKADSTPLQIHIDGSSTVFPLSEAVVEDFQNLYPDVKVTLNTSGTRGGFQKFSQGKTDINNASSPIMPEEAAACRSNDIAYLELAVAYDGLAVVVNPTNTWARDIKVSELKKLWAPEAQGKITRWNQIRPEWPDKEIHLYGPGAQSGTFDFFTEAIMGKAKSSRDDYKASEYDEILVQGIAIDEFALGYFGLSYYENNKYKLKLLAVDDEISSNGNGSVLPTPENVRNHAYSPLSRPLYIYVNSKSLEREEVQDFVSFYIDIAEILAAEVGYIPLTAQQNDSLQNRWDNFLKLNQ